MKKTTALEEQVRSALAWLKSHSTKATLEGMARYAIPSDHAYGVAMKDIKALGKKLGRNHALALALWDTGVYEARMLTSFVADPAQLTPEQMDRWCKDFDNWAFCDTLCFNLFDRSRHAWDKVRQWSRRALHAAALEVARRLASSKEPAARWVGKEALRELSSPSAAKRPKA